MHGSPSGIISFAPVKTEDDPPLEVLVGRLKEASEEERDPQAHLPDKGASRSGIELGLWVPCSEGEAGGLRGHPRTRP